MATSVGQPLDRVDGRLKVTGAARYSAEFNRPGLVHAVLVQSAIARGRIRSLDTRAAERAPGIIAVITHRNRLPLAKPVSPPAGQSFPILGGPEIYYSGQTIGVVVADTLEHAQHGAELVKATYDAEAPTVIMAEHLDQAFRPTAGGRPTDSGRGDVAQGLAPAEVTIDQVYTTPVEHHNPMEPHATVAVWEDDNLTVYDATQAVYNTRQSLAEVFGLEQDKVRVVSYFLGGGFGCKGQTWPHTPLAALAARQVGRPVKLVLRRQQMFTSNGHRPFTHQHTTLGATRDGKLTAVRHIGITHTSEADEFVEPTGLMTNMMYSCPNVQVQQRLVRVNLGTPTYTRAPGEASGSFSIESAMDELAYALKLDPIELRERNYAEIDESEKRPWSSKSLRECYRLGAERFNWARRTAEPRSMREGRYLIGLGVAGATYPANFRAASARARFFADGTALVQSATQDIGTGTYTVMTQIAADTLTLPVEQVRFELGDTRLPESPGSGGSCSAASAGSAVQAAANALKQRLITMALANESSPLFGLTARDVTVENARIFARDNPRRGATYQEILAGYNLRVVEARASAQPGAERGQQGGGSPQGTEQGLKAERGTEAGQAAAVGASQGESKTGAAGGQEAKGGGYSMHSFGAQFCEVRVDEELGQVRVARMVGVFGAGRILNAKTARSQMLGGMTFGIGMALMEESALDPNKGRIVTRNLADYHVPVHADIPEFDVQFVEEHDPHVNPIGVKGIGEIGIVGAAAAVANAVYHATGKRIRDLPITPDKLL
jgi:xanthine dehydrogenase YagR molybdenum-binding subunit